MSSSQGNLDQKTVEGFGHEWTTFRQGDELPAEERSEIFADYFGIFPWSKLPGDAVGIDVGCGSGRWALLVASRVKHLHTLDASPMALETARKNLAELANVSFHAASVDAIPLPDASLDFAYSLGVLHHVPDTAGAIRDIARKLKPGAPFLVYLYYAFENRPLWYRAIWRASNSVRLVVSRLPRAMRLGISQVIAVVVYWPLARAARTLDKAGRLPESWPLAYYRDKSFYVLRTDAFDRFCTRIEQRFTRAQIEAMLTAAGFTNVRFSESEPYWCAVATKT
ncbi:MAG TPA: class I SAM-dependent methyltransferase [Pirellulales bacterium]|jgi:ubiquinone/menaquinone biosynthesis C-methylase UbiE|nr:class I SAM-dependent methyltransferase [Pirellulales bacterium]